MALQREEHMCNPDKTSSVRRSVPDGSKQEENFNWITFKKIEGLIEKMQDSHTGIPVRTVKHFMSKIPTVFTGSSLINWLTTKLQIDDPAEALHLAHLIAAHGYIFPIEDHILTVKNDVTYYRFQTPFLWPSNSWDPDNYDYAVYLCKRTMQNKQRLELADYEAEILARLQKTFCRKWEFVYMQAEAQAKVDRRRDRIERKVLDSQEQAFWDVHRPAPGCVDTTEVDMKKLCRSHKQPIKINPMVEQDAECRLENLRREVERLQNLNQRRRIKMSKVSESYASYFEQYGEFDSFITPPEPSNPWLSESVDFWQFQTSVKDIPPKRIKRWTFGLHELLKDPAGREHFRHFLEKEFSAENLKFWEACEGVKRIPLKDVEAKVFEIYCEYLGKSACDPVNLDGRVLEAVKKRMDEKPDRYCLDEAQDHIFLLMKRDSYNRYIRLDLYKDFSQVYRKKSKRRFGSVRRLYDISAKINFPTRYSEI